MNKLEQLAEQGQAIWLDYIRRHFIKSGELGELIEQGLRGITSNPSIFQKAITGSDDYDETLRKLVLAGRETDEIYETLAIQDIRDAADLLRPVYDRTEGRDGYVSLEVNPNLAYDTEGTINEARRLFEIANRPNVLIKVPATKPGIPAIETLIGEGINVNVTLMFSLGHYRAVSDAYIRGLESRVASGQEVSRIASVASFFVSRVDTAVDQELEDIGNTSLQGKIAIANAKIAYDLFQQTFQGTRWERLAAAGARVQRPLWASTSTKNPAYSDTLYVDSLIGPQTVNTVPQRTLRAFMDHGTVARTVDKGLDEAKEALDQLDTLGVSLEAITEQLQEEGVRKFSDAFQELMEGIAEKREDLLTGRQWVGFELGAQGKAVNETVKELAAKKVAKRIWARDHTVWKPEPTEIANRLAWLDIADEIDDEVPRIEALAQNVRNEGYTDVLLCGMGGSSLAPEVFAKTFGDQVEGLRLEVLDSTSPDAVLAQRERLDPERTLFVISTKSGTTVETLSFFKFFYNWMRTKVGQEKVGRHFVGITDPGSNLADLAEEYNFRAAFLNNPNIGGRYSALSYFGLVPAALVGVSLQALLGRAQTAMCNTESCVSPENNHALQLGAALATLAQKGRDKLTLVAPPAIASFGDWVEQLVAESLGKEGKGILPVVGEPLGSPQDYGRDRVFVHFYLGDNAPAKEELAALAEAGHPVINLYLRDRYDLGAQFFLWEMATAVAGHLLDVNPFNQPNVEAAKTRAKEMVSAYQQEGKLPEPTPSFSENGITVYGAKDAQSLDKALEDFLAQADRNDRPESYIALQAYVRQTAQTDQALCALQEQLRDRTKLATTVGYGPRFLHSTGQLHKGDAGHGLFVQLTAEAERNAPIPDKAGEESAALTFGVLIRAQALGDRRALEDAGREVLRLHLGDDVSSAIDHLLEALSE